MAQRPRGDRGAAAVEFALVLPLLVMLVFGIIEFGLALNAKIELTGAAREAARFIVVGGRTSDAINLALEDAPTACRDDSPCTVDFAYSDKGTACASGETVVATVTRPGWHLGIPLVTDLTFDLTGKAAMRCGG